VFVSRVRMVNGEKESASGRKKKRDKSVLGEIRIVAHNMQQYVSICVLQIGGWTQA
jgi:hypothetical protein